MLKANYKQLKELDLNKIDQDNVRWYDALMKNKGSISSLNYKAYVDFLCEMNIFYTLDGN